MRYPKRFSIVLHSSEQYFTLRSSVRTVTPQRRHWTSTPSRGFRWYFAACLHLFEQYFARGSRAVKPVPHTVQVKSLGWRGISE